MKKNIQAAALLTISSLLVNAGNYGSNYLMSRFLSLAQFSEANLIVTLFIGISFLATAFQLSAAKSITEDDSSTFAANIYTAAGILGLFVGGAFILGAHSLSIIFHFKSAFPFYILGIASPIYFIMSVGRGLLQGRTEWKKWMLSFHLEMWSRLILSIILMYLGAGSDAVAISLLLSIIIACAIIPSLSFVKLQDFPKTLKTFFVGIIVYEFAQILINNGDVFLVKYYFDGNEAGGYAALSLMGKISYFATWTIAQYMIGEVIQMKKAGKDTNTFFLTMLGLLSVIIAALVSGLSFLSQEIVFYGFGVEYMSIAPLLGKYALLSGLFAICNIFIYYNLFFGQKAPLYITLVVAFTQLIVMTFFHTSLKMIIDIQLIAITILTIFLIIRQFVISKKRLKTTIHRVIPFVYRKARNAAA